MCMRYQIMIGMVCLGRCFRHGVDAAYMDRRAANHI